MTSPGADAAHTTQLQDLVELADLDAITHWLLEADTDQLAAARKWFVEGRRQTEHLYRWDGPLRQARRDAHEPGADIDWKLAWIRAILATALAGPVSAAKWIPWDRIRLQDGAALPALLAVASARGETWCRDFVPAAAEQPYWRLYDLLMPLIARFGLPAPSGRPFVASWFGTYRRIEIAAAVARAADDPMFPEFFHRFLDFAELRHDDQYAGLTAALTAAGCLERARLVDQIVGLLTAQRAAHEQRALAKVLAALDVQDDELPAGMSYLQGMIATCHGSVGKLLLPFALRRMHDEADVIELCTTIAGRPERAQQQALLAALGDPQVRRRLGRPVVVAGLETFREVVGDDARAVAIVDKHLAAAGSKSTREPAPEASGLWHLRPAGERWQSPHLGEYPTLDEDARGLLAWLVAHFTESGAPDRNRILPDLGLAAIVRGGAVDPRGARRQAARLGIDKRSYAVGPTVTGIRDGAVEPGVDAFHEALSLARSLPDDNTDPHRWFDTAAGATTIFRYLVAREAMTRLGRNPCLLSTPKHEDHSICLPALVPRLQLCHGASVGPLDLLLTLLRLRPARPRELDALAGLRVPLDDAVRIPGSGTTVTDAVDAIRVWVEAGGVPALGTDGRDGVRTPTPRLPISPEQFGAHESWFDGPAPRGYYFGSGDIAAVVPLWRDLSRISGGGDGHSSDYRRTDYTYLLHSEMPPSFAAHTFLVTALAGDFAEGRDDSVRAVLTLIGQGRFDPQLFAQALVHAIDGPALGKTRFADALELLVRNGGLQSIWEPLLLLTQAMIGCDRRPASLHRMLALLTRFVHEVPEPRLPTKIRDFASERGNTKSHHEARALVAAADRSRT